MTAFFQHLPSAMDAELTVTYGHESQHMAEGNLRKTDISTGMCHRAEDGHQTQVSGSTGKE